jgi:hypothetical protein
MSIFVEALFRVLISLIVLAECAYQMPVTPSECGMGWL